MVKAVTLDEERTLRELARRTQTTYTLFYEELNKLKPVKDKIRIRNKSGMSEFELHIINNYKSFINNLLGDGEEETTST